MIKCNNQTCNQEALHDFNIESDEVSLKIPLCKSCFYIVKDEDFSYATDSVSLKN